MKIITARKKPVEVECVRWMGERVMMPTFEKITNTIIDSNIYPATEGHAPALILAEAILDLFEPFFIEMARFVPTANIGDYIVRGVNGEFYPVKPDIFEKTYDVVGERNEPVHPQKTTAIQRRRGEDKRNNKDS